jgi:hypothetical protein
MINKVVFYNMFHYGDLHVSRGLVREVSRRCVAKGIKCEYIHNYSDEILKDIQDIQIVKSNYNITNITPSHVSGDTVFINTWYGGNKDIFNSYGLTFDCLYRSFKEAVKPLDIDFDSINPIDMFPSIDYEKYQIENAKLWLNNNIGKRKLFISNGLTLSGQFENFKFSNIINRLARDYPETQFIISNDEPGIHEKDNIIFTKNIIQKNGNDLNENSYLASNCDIIIGRFSGTYTFAMTKENYFDKPKHFIVFTIPSVDKYVWTYEFTPIPPAKIVRFGCSEENAVYTAINTRLN